MRTAQKLLELGVPRASFAEPNAVGHTPLNKAAAKGEVAMVDFLLDQIVPPANLLLRDQTGRSAADAAGRRRVSPSRGAPAVLRGPGPGRGAARSTRRRPLTLQREFRVGSRAPRPSPTSPGGAQIFS